MSTRPADPSPLTPQVQPRAASPAVARAAVRAPVTPTPGQLDATAMELVDGLFDQDLSFRPPPPGFGTWLARLYVARRRWLTAALAAAALMLLFAAGYFLVWTPIRNAQLEQGRVELAETLPSRIASAFEAVYDETKVQQAATIAAKIRDAGLAAAKAGDRAGAETALTQLTAMLQTLKQTFSVVVVSSPGSKWGFWTIPPDNNAETNYYLVVQAEDDGTVVPLPIGDEVTGRTETVTSWAVRVPEEVYRTVQADKNDNGTIDDPDVGHKEDGYLDLRYHLPVLGTLTRW